MNKYEIMGSKIFQKIVFKIESIKFKILDKFIPNYEKISFKYLDYKKRKKLNKAKTIEECNNIIDTTRFLKLLIKKEKVYKKNINYHINKDNILDFEKYLLYNKNIHKKGLIKNIVVMILSIICISLKINVLSAISVFLLIINTFGLVINFECVNLQNYNLDRLHKHIEKNKDRIKKKELEKVEKYGKVSCIVQKEFDKTDDIPNGKDIINKMNRREELEQFKKMLLERNNKKMNNINIYEKKKVKKC